ncbi:MAG TPA: type II secretion system protein, partial [Chthoniobacteraceae bacterium]|nr:type II secretion system protein [Chthoniobacteraceae bacterium]
MGDSDHTRQGAAYIFCAHGSHPYSDLDRSRGHPGLAAFTLLELLVIVGVVALLAAIALPVLARTKSAGRMTVCVSNLKQWGIATHVFASDHDDFLPPDGSPNGTSTKSGWYIDLPKAMSIPTYAELDWPTNMAITPPPSVWVCPNSTNRSNGRNLFFYCLNQHVNDTGAANRPVTIDSVMQPSLTVWLFDNGKRAAVAQQNNVALNLHRGGAQFLFLDGHVARFPAAAYWDARSNRGRTNNPELVWIPR